MKVLNWKNLAHGSCIAAALLLAACNGGGSGSGGNGNSGNTNNTSTNNNLSIILAKSSTISPEIHPITAYVLLESQSIDYLANTLVPDVQNGTVKANRIVLSFLDPNFDLNKYNANSGNLDNLLTTSGILSTVQAGDGQRLANVIKALHKNNIQVYFAAGGWSYSCLDQNNPNSTASCTTNFPLTPDMIANFNAALPDISSNLSNLPNQIQSVSSENTPQYVQGWTNLVKAFGGDGIDLDYEENWFATEVTYRYGAYLLATNPTWSNVPNGPFVLPLSVIKYGTYLKELEIASKADKLNPPTTAAPAPAAYNIHNHVGGAMYWCAVQDDKGNNICGQTAVNPISVPAIIGGNLKGVLYDMANYTETDVTQYTSNGQNYIINYNNVKDSNGNVLFDGVITGLDEINPMTYDLDDGYDTIGGSWCIGESSNGQFISRDPTNPDFYNVDCALPAQMHAITKMFKLNVTRTNTHLGFGLEVGFPNYPINISPGLQGGGNGPQAESNMHYRWNDKFVAFDLPLNIPSESDMNILNALQSISQFSDVSNSVPDMHSSYLIVNNNLFKSMTQAGADGLIIWSLNNDDYNQHLSESTSWDYQQYLGLPSTSSAFGYTYFGGNLNSKYANYTNEVYGILFNDSITPEKISVIANDYWMNP